MTKQTWNYKELAEKTSDAYSADRYVSWAGCARQLKMMGFTVEEAEAILRSKWTRWAGDAAKNPNRPTADDLLHFIARQEQCVGKVQFKKDVQGLVDGTF